MLLSSSRAASVWVRSPRRTACMILRTSRSFWLMGIRSGESTLIDMSPPWPEQGGHFYCVKTGHFYCRSTQILGRAGSVSDRRHSSGRSRSRLALNVVIQVKLIGVRPQPDGVDLFFALGPDPGVDHVGGDHV